MTNSIIHSYEEFRSDVLEKKDVYKVKFSINGVHPSMSNAIRRVLLGKLPIVAFDDTYMDNPEDNKIKIRKNVSALHNEFIAHRLSLLPICMYNNTSLKVLIDYDFDEGDFKFGFASSDTVPIFNLTIKNDENTRKLRGANSDNSINITSEFITIENEKEYNPVHEFFIRDYVTGDYVLLHRLKPISSNEEVQEAEELEIILKPDINVGRIHARYCPVGTVSYEFQKDSQEVQDKYFENYIESN